MVASGARPCALAHSLFPSSVRSRHFGPRDTQAVHTMALGIAMVAGRIEVLALFSVLNIAYWRRRQIE